MDNEKNFSGGNPMKKNISRFVIVLMSLLISSCEGLVEDKGVPVCASYAVSNAAYLGMDPNLFLNKQSRIYDGAKLVIDTCAATTPDTSPLFYRLDFSNNPTVARLTIYFYDEPLPSTGVLSLMTASDCAHAFTPAGTANFNYDFKLMSYGCGGTPSIASQDISFL